MNDLLAMCIISALVILLVAIGGAFLPKYLQEKEGIDNSASRERYAVAFKLGNIFSGGVMLSAGMVHLLGDSIRIPKGQDASYNFNTMKFPLAPFLTALGCLLTLTMDALVDMYTHRKKSSDKLLFDAVELSDACHQKDAECGQCNGDALLRNKNSIEAPDKVKVESSDKVIYRGMEMNGNKQVQNGGEKCQQDWEEECQEQNHERVLLEHTHGALPKDVSFLTGLVLAAALSVHSILEGAALGAQQHASQLRDIFVAIVAHKGMAAYALGAALLESKPSNIQFWTVISTFCLASPIGIFVGYGISGLNGKAGLALSALAAGTFLYVALMEVIPKELGDANLKGWKIIFLWLGFSLMSIIAIWV